MFNLIKNLFKYNSEIKKYRYMIDSLKTDLTQILAISEKYLPIMKTSDKIQLLILRRNAWIKKP